ncbi:hypothetical protein GCM10010169_36750 [Micromonospora fulviviridis]|nr:hypothetical protein GCM10010169_36750 [Micromonospora fulviviridis]
MSRAMHMRLPSGLTSGFPTAAKRGIGVPAREPVSYLSCWRRTISVIQTGANGEVQPGEVG